MEDIMNVAAYIALRYESEFKEPIEDMKLHKLMYFAQRESFIQSFKPLFDATFYGWKSGPVLKELLSAEFKNIEPTPFNSNHDSIFDKIFSDFATKSSESLSQLSRGEESWQNSRKGIYKFEKSDNPMCTDDIQRDAEYLRARRQFLNALSKKCDLTELTLALYDMHYKTIGLTSFLGANRDLRARSRKDC